MNQLIDHKQLNQFTENDTEMLADLAIIFARAVPNYVARINLAIAESDGDELRESSHQIKSQLNYFFCESLVEKAIELEEMGLQGLTEDTLATFNELTEGINQLLAELEQLTGLSLQFEED